MSSQPGSKDLWKPEKKDKTKSNILIEHTKNRKGDSLVISGANQQFITNKSLHILQIKCTTITNKVPKVIGADGGDLGFMGSVKLTLVLGTRIHRMQITWKKYHSGC